MKSVLLPCLVVSGVLLGGSTASVPLLMGTPAEAQVITQSPAPPRDLPPVPDAVLQLADRFEAIARKVSPAVVAVAAVKTVKSNPAGRGKVTEGAGSGLVMQVDCPTSYFVPSNNHRASEGR